MNVLKKPVLLQVERSEPKDGRNEYPDLDGLISLTKIRLKIPCALYKDPQHTQAALWPIKSNNCVLWELKKLAPLDVTKRITTSAAPLPASKQHYNTSNVEPALKQSVTKTWCWKL